MTWKSASAVCACLMFVSVGKASAQGNRIPANRGPSDDGFPALRFAKWVEPKERAFSIEVPQGWTVEGGVNWLSQIDPEGFVRLRSPDGKINVFFGDPEILTREVPTPAGRMQTGVNEGQVFRSPSGGPAMLERYLTGTQYAKEHVTWRLCRSPNWVTEKDLPEVSQALGAAIEPEARKYNIHGTANAGEVTYTCGDMQGAAFATTFIVGQGGPIQIWGVYRVAGFQSADPLHSMEARYIMEHLLATFVIDQRWQDDLDRRTMQLTGSVMSMQNAATEAIRTRRQYHSRNCARMRRYRQVRDRVEHSRQLLHGSQRQRSRGLSRKHAAGQQRSVVPTLLRSRMRGLSFEQVDDLPTRPGFAESGEDARDAVGVSVGVHVGHRVRSERDVVSELVCVTRG